MLTHIVINFIDGTFLESNNNYSTEIKNNPKTVFRVRHSNCNNSEKL
ncbi:unnamed protein product [Tenebrio molitor]|nr:unnamed protein product [Tenebrio molitor]